jgi:hypothetical protein
MVAIGIVDSNAGDVVVVTFERDKFHFGKEAH